MSHVIEYLDEKENCNRKGIENDIAIAARYNGDGWQGPMHWHDEVKPLKNYNAAQKWIEEHDKGWYDDHAVRYYDYCKVKPTKKMGELQQKIRELREQKVAYENLHSVKKRKSEYIGCPKCGSKLFREYLKSEYCPLCRSDLRSQTTLDTLANYDKRIQKVQIQLEDETEKQKGEVRWLIKYEYHQ